MHRVLIVDDSVVARSVMERVIGAAPGFTVAGAVTDAARALAFLAKERVDIILLDIQLPGIDGLTALPGLLTAGAGAKVLIVSSSAAEGAAASVQALALGATDTLVKPGVGGLASRFADTLTEKLNRLAASASMPVRPLVPPPALPLPPQAIPPVDIVAIGASTGGIHALSQLLAELPPSMTAPILITQHLPASFMTYFAAQVSTMSGRPCAVAVDHLRIRPGQVIVAPGHAHMLCVPMADGASIRLSEAPAPSGCMPSVDPMFHAVAQTYGERALGIVLSGMGRDGLRGARELVSRGGTLIAQDQASSVVWGMPGAIVGEALTKIVLPPAEIGRVISRLRRAAA